MKEACPPMQITVHYARCCGDPKNTLYPYSRNASTEEEFAALVAQDHMFSAMRGGCRSNANFTGASAIPVDIDNDHTEDPDGWLSPEDLAGSFPDVACVTYTSRHHMKPKGGKAARPRFHAAFPVPAVPTQADYSALMKRLQAYFPFIDGNAADPARFFFGNPGAEVRFHPGGRTLDVFLEEQERNRAGGFASRADRQLSAPRAQPIPEGSRNSTMYGVAVRLLKRFGDTAECRAAFRAEAERCSPPLPERELDAVWNSASRFYHGVVSVQPGYVPPVPAPAAEEVPPFIVFGGRWHDKPAVDPPALARHIRETVPYLVVQDSGLEDPRFYVYDGGVYRLYSEKMMMGVIKAPVEEYDYRLVSMPKIREAYNQIVSDLSFTSADELDADESIVNFRNGLLRVTADDLTLLPHSPAVRSTIQLDCSWPGREVPTPVFDRYMAELTGGDAQLEQLILEFMGACFSNICGWRMKKSLILVGPGDTGKSQVRALTERILGRGNYISADMQNIENRFGSGSIYGTRLIGSSDMSYMAISELKTFKMLTGGDSLFAEFKGKQPFSFAFKGLSWFCTNGLPKFGGDDGRWVFDRFLIIFCNNVIPKELQDHQLLDRLCAEREGIVYRALKAVQTVIANGYRFSEPESVRQAREEYRAENSTPISFYNECMCGRDEAQAYIDCCTTGRIYNVYKAWCRDNNHGYCKTAREFRDALADYLGEELSETVHRENGNYYRYLTLHPEVIDHYYQAFSPDSR